MTSIITKESSSSSSRILTASTSVYVAAAAAAAAAAARVESHKSSIQLARSSTAPLYYYRRGVSNICKFFPQSGIERSSRSYYIDPRIFLFLVERKSITPCR